MKIEDETLSFTQVEVPNEGGRAYEVYEQDQSYWYKIGDIKKKVIVIKKLEESFAQAKSNYEELEQQKKQSQ